MIAAHGTTARYAGDLRCRCYACREAWNVYQRDRREFIRLFDAVPPLPHEWREILYMYRQSPEYSEVREPHYQDDKEPANARD